MGTEPITRLGDVPVYKKLAQRRRGAEKTLLLLKTLGGLASLRGNGSL
jgi:hypothetical protein